MRLLVTGANGFIGRSLLPHLKKNNFEVITLGRNPAEKATEHVTLDLLQADNLVDVLKKIHPTHLIHLAWYTEHGKYWESQVNLQWVIATWNLLNAFYAAGGEHALVAGTCAEYDWKCGYCIEDLTPAIPSTVYGVSKDTSRRLSELAAIKHNATLGWARIFFPYGLGEPSTRLIPSLFDVFKGKTEPFSVGYSAYRDLLHVSDVASALAICSQQKAKGIVNVSSGEPTPIVKIIETVAKLCKQDPGVVLRKDIRKTNDPIFLIGNNEKLKSLGWRKSVDLECGLKEFI